MLLPLITICSLFIAAAFAAIAWHVLREEGRREEARVAALGAAMDPASRASGPAASLFETNRQSPVQGAPLTTIGIGVAMAIVVIVAIAMTGGHPRATRNTASIDAAAPVTRGAVPLELVSMTNARAGDALTVTGLVRNVSAAPTHGLIAVVFAFDRDGNFVSSARAPVDDVTLGAGDESPFRVTVPHAAEAGRYRVSFRTDAGVIRHLDRRGSMQASAR